MADEAISEVTICNSALIKLGVDTITSLDQDTKAARICNARYAMLRNKVLEDHSWAFATKEVQLAALTSPAPLMDWTYFYQLPEDCLKILRGDDWETRFEEVDGYLASKDNTNGTINIKYIAKVTDPGQYSYNFAECLAWRIAADISYAMTQSVPVGQAMMQGYDMDLKAARYHDSHKRSPEKLHADSWIAARN